MKFDKIIMNPPYNKNLHLKILAEAIKHLSDDGTCVNLSPIRWLQDPLAKYKKNSDYKKFEDSVAKHIESLDVISQTEASTLFQTAFWNQLGISILIKDNENTLYEHLMDGDPLQKLRDRIGFPIFRKENGFARIYDMNSLNKDYPYWIKMSRVHGHADKNDEFDCITPKLEIVLNKTGHEGREIFFKTREEAVNFHKSLLCIFNKFIKKLGCCPARDFTQALPWMGDAVNPRTGKKGYESEWTDEDFYKYFGITEDEQMLIKETMEKYK